MNKALEELKSRVRHDAREAKPDAPEPDQDTWEEQAGDGRSSRHQVLGVQLIDDKKHVHWIPYGAVVWAEGTHNGGSYTFSVIRGEVMWEAVIEGPPTALQAIVDRMMEGKRLSVRVNSATVTAITMRPMKKPATT